MTTTKTRRNFLAATGIVVGSAGCLGRIQDRFGDDPENMESDEDDIDQWEWPATDKGTEVDSFENLDPWTIGVGEYDSSSEERVRGTQSLRLISQSDGDSAGAFRTFDEPLDLSESHLSLAVDVSTTGPARIQVTLEAPDGANRVRATRHLVSDLEGWIRTDLGYTAEDGDPNLSEVTQLEIIVNSVDGGEVECYLDDLRKTPAREDPNATLVFHNGLSSHYETAYPILEERDLVGVVPTNEVLMDASGRLDVGELRQMRDVGWDVVSRPAVDERLPALDADEQRAAIEFTQTYLEERGFPDGSRHFVSPGYSMDASTVEIIRDVHDTGLTFGGAPNANPPVTKYTASTLDGDAGESTRRRIEIASKYKQSLVLGISRVEEGHEFDPDDLLDLLGTLDAYGVEVVSLSEVHEN